MTSTMYLKISKITIKASMIPCFSYHTEKNRYYTLILANCQEWWWIQNIHEFFLLLYFFPYNENKMIYFSEVKILLDLNIIG